MKRTALAFILLGLTQTSFAYQILNEWETMSLGTYGTTTELTTNDIGAAQKKSVARTKTMLAAWPHTILQQVSANVNIPFNIYGKHTIRIHNATDHAVQYLC